LPIRIISGKFRGRKLKAPAGLDIRPTLDRVKESIFNVLGERIIDAEVLDLFSGTGSLGLESLSRGCSLVYFIDNNIQSINLIRYNTDKIATGQKDTGEFRIVKKDVRQYLRFCNDKKWDIIFIDPPYRISGDVMRDIFDCIAAKGAADCNTIIIYEFFFKRRIETEIERLKVVKRSFFGDKEVAYLKKD
jgi:16S rRNA (guanine966-N2)-methyltransferase